jgi:hypothetical protein
MARTGPYLCPICEAPFDDIGTHDQHLKKAHGITIGEDEEDFV